MSAAAEPATVPVGSPEYAEVVEFLYREARALDQSRWDDWLALLAPEIDYRMPVRLERMPKDGPGFVEESEFFTENHSSLTTRVRRLQTEQAWAEEPGSRQRHFVTNVGIERREDGGYDVVSNFLVTRTRSDLPYDIFTGERRDVVRREEDGEGLLLAKRLILLDQTVLLSYNLSIFI
jgi:3-phenylpropionate/cinnamic acid dioxygenase small subunit